MTTATLQELEIDKFSKSNLTTKIRIPEGFRVLEPGEDDSGAILVIRIVNQRDGDKRIVWDAEDWSQIRDAKDLFDELIEQGMVPYIVDPEGRKSPQVMTEFDPFAEEVIMSDDLTKRRRREVVATPQPMLAGG